MENLSFSRAAAAYMPRPWTPRSHTLTWNWNPSSSPWPGPVMLMMMMKTQPTYEMCDNDLGTINQAFGFPAVESPSRDYRNMYSGGRISTLLYTQRGAEVATRWIDKEIIHRRGQKGKNLSGSLSTQFLRNVEGGGRSNWAPRKAERSKNYPQVAQLKVFDCWFLFRWRNLLLIPSYNALSVQGCRNPDDDFLHSYRRSTLATWSPISSSAIERCCAVSISSGLAEERSFARVKKLLRVQWTRASFDWLLLPIKNN